MDRLRNACLASEMSKKGVLVLSSLQFFSGQTHLALVVTRCVCADLSKTRVGQVLSIWVFIAVAMGED